jgi:hypothetical protein
MPDGVGMAIGAAGVDVHPSVKVSAIETVEIAAIAGFISALLQWPSQLVTTGPPSHGFETGDYPKPMGE